MDQGLCLDVKSGGKANGTEATLWYCNGTASQQWTYDGQTLRNVASGRCLDVPGWNTTDGTRLVIWDCNGGANQSWKAPSAP
ncbi:RICIN domain-containing protein [Streptomyces erythrogriseus]